MNISMEQIQEKVLGRIKLLVKRLVDETIERRAQEIRRAWKQAALGLERCPDEDLSSIRKRENTAEPLCSSSMG